MQNPASALFEFLDIFNERGRMGGDLVDITYLV